MNTFFTEHQLATASRPPDKSDSVKHINNVFTETAISDKPSVECGLLGDINIHLLFDEK